MECKKFYCRSCNCEFEKFVAHAVLRVVCPTCSNVVKIAEYGMSKGLSLGEIAIGLFVGWVVYNAFKSS